MEAAQVCPSAAEPLRPTSLLAGCAAQGVGLGQGVTLPHYTSLVIELWRRLGMQQCPAASH